MPRPRLVETMLDADNASTRSARLRTRRDAPARIRFVLTWLKTALLATPRARGLRAFAWPWLCINGVSVLWTSLYELALPKRTSSLGSFGIVYQLVFSTMGFLLVFRLSRAAVRFWDCRTAFGSFNVGVRRLVDRGAGARERTRRAGAG
jgi:putative membrane protein